MSQRYLLILLLCFSPGLVFANEIMFEGYSRIEISNKPVGYAIQRYEFDAKTNNFVAISFLRAKFNDKTVQESYKATATDKFHPVSFSYTSQVGEVFKVIDGTFKGEQMTLKIVEGKKVKTEVYKNVKGTFLSSFLPYLMLQKKLELNEAFKYSAVAEEDGGSYWGKAALQKKETRNGYDLYTIANEYKGEKFISKMAVVKDPKNPDKNIRGEVFSTSSPNQNLTSELVAEPNKATEGQLIPNKILLTLFGNIPTGKANLIATPPPAEEKPAGKKPAQAEANAEGP